MTAHIYIYGVINDEGENSLKSIVNQLNSHQNYDDVCVHIHSVGGLVSEGRAIYYYLKSLNKPITTINEGYCYSIATIVLLAGDVDKRISLPGAQFMVHNPWSQVQGDSASFARVSDELKIIEGEMSLIYENNTKIDKQTSLTLMSKESFFSAEEALSYGFISAISDGEKAVAVYKKENNTNNNKNMNNNNDSILTSIKNKIDALYKKINKINGLVVQDANGMELDFKELNSSDIIKVGDVAEVENKKAEGEYTMPNGDVYRFQNGELVAIDVFKDNNTDLLTKQIEELKKEINDLKQINEDNLNTIDTYNKEIKEIRSQISSTFSYTNSKIPNNNNKNTGKFFNNQK